MVIFFKLLYHLFFLPKCFYNSFPGNSFLHLTIQHSQDSLSFFKQLSGTLKDIKDIKSIKSDLDIEEQRAKIDLLKKQAEVGTKTDPTVIVKFEDGVSEWAK